MYGQSFGLTRGDCRDNEDCVAIRVWRGSLRPSLQTGVYRKITFSHFRFHLICCVFMYPPTVNLNTHFYPNFLFELIHHDILIIVFVNSLESNLLVHANSIIGFLHRKRCLFIPHFPKQFKHSLHQACSNPLISVFL